MARRAQTARYKFTLLGKAIILLFVGATVFVSILITKPAIPIMPNIKDSDLSEISFNIYFHPESVEIDESQYTTLEKAIFDTKNNATKLLYIVGNCSVQKDTQYATASSAHSLALERANAVTNYFMSKGVPGFQIVILENGSLNPNPSGSDDRVELYLKSI